MAYFTHTDLEDRMASNDFSATTKPTDVQVDAMGVEISAMWDGLADQTEGTETPSEQVKQACMSAGVYQVNQIRAGEPIDQEVQMRIMKEFLKTTKTQMSYNQKYPTRAGKW